MWDITCIQMLTKRLLGKKEKMHATILKGNLGIWWSVSWVYWGQFILFFVFHVCFSVSIANKINSSNLLCLFLTVLFSQISLKIPRSTPQLNWINWEHKDLVVILFRTLLPGSSIAAFRDKIVCGQQIIFKARLYFLKSRLS